MTKMMKNPLLYLSSLALGGLIGWIITPIALEAFQSIPTISSAKAATCTILFDQAATDLAEAQSLKYEAVIDNAAPITITATCSGAASPFSCTTPLPAPAQTVGTHTLALQSSFLLSDGSYLPSSLSVVYNYRVKNPPAAPINVRIKIN